MTTVEHRCPQRPQRPRRERDRRLDLEDFARRLAAVAADLAGLAAELTAAATQETDR